VGDGEAIATHENALDAGIFTAIAEQLDAILAFTYEF
jgi:hypothetical protein